MLDCLERDGVVERRASATDRRSVNVVLTPAGRSLVGRKRKLVAAKRRAIFNSLSAADREQAERLLGRLAAAVEEL